MGPLTEIAIERSHRGIFTRSEVAIWLGGTPNRQFSAVKRALASGEILRVRRGLYSLAPRFLRQKIDPLVLAQRISGPSYISLESALSYYGWIPEAVYTVTSVSADRSREFDTPVGRFSFTRVPQRTLYAGVERVEKEGDSLLLASPLKALADYVYAHKKDWVTARPLIESLRVDDEAVSELRAASFDPLLANYRSHRVLRFLHGLKKEVGK